MSHILRAADRPADAPRTIRFEGAAYGASISFFAVVMAPGKSVGLHVHPYTETWLVQDGEVLFHAGGETLTAGVGDIMIVEPDTVHGFENIGPIDLKMMCIHDSPQIVQRFLDPADA